MKINLSNDERIVESRALSIDAELSHDREEVSALHQEAVLVSLLLVCMNHATTHCWHSSNS